jgi:alkanesulfonate monooxygenase SsuD/methylene tetrahydromethanopterin reductase-like flavin-dependent oxidoreductase (luciferase family)
VQQPYPPFVIGGSGEKLTLRVVAKHAAVWNFVAGPVEEFQRKVGILKQHCEAVGRDIQTIDLSTQVQVNYDNLAKAAERTKTFIEAGANHFVYTLTYPYPEDIISRLADEVVGAVHENR